MLISNITTEFKDSNGTLMVVWDYIREGNRQEVIFIHDILFAVKDCTRFHELIFLHEEITAIRSSLLAWAATKTIEQLKAKKAD